MCQTEDTTVLFETQLQHSCTSTLSNYNKYITTIASQMKQDIMHTRVATDDGLKQVPMQVTQIVVQGNALDDSMLHIACIKLSPWISTCRLWKCLIGFYALALRKHIWCTTKNAHVHAFVYMHVGHNYTQTCAPFSVWYKPTVLSHYGCESLFWTTCSCYTK